MHRPNLPINLPWGIALCPLSTVVRGTCTNGIVQRTTCHVACASVRVSVDKRQAPGPQEERAKWLWHSWSCLLALSVAALSMSARRRCKTGLSMCSHRQAGIVRTGSPRSAEIASSGCAKLARALASPWPPLNTVCLAVAELSGHVVRAALLPASRAGYCAR